MENLPDVPQMGEFSKIVNLVDRTARRVTGDWQGRYQGNDIRIYDRTIVTTNDYPFHLPRRRQVMESQII